MEYRHNKILRLIQGNEQVSPVHVFGFSSEVESSLSRFFYSLIYSDFKVSERRYDLFTPLCRTSKYESLRLLRQFN